MDKNNFLCEINGVKYIIFNIPIVSQKVLSSLNEKIKKHNGILQGAEKRGTFWSVYVVATVLIPEQRALDFSNEQ